MYGLIGKRTCWSYFCYMSMGVREWLRWWVAFLGGLLLCQERYWALQEYAHFGLYNRQITKLSEWPMLEWTLSTTSTAQRCVWPVSFSGGFITAMVVNQPERKLAKRTSVHCSAPWSNQFFLKLVIWKVVIESSYLVQMLGLPMMVYEGKCLFTVTLWGEVMIFLL